MGFRETESRRFSENSKKVKVEMRKNTDVTKTCGLPARAYCIPMQIFACYSREAFLSRFFIGTLVRQSEINCHFTLLRGT